jgi:DNA polymerase
MDAREQLRRFLEQRKEAGETELVFDSLSVDEAMAILGAAPPVSGDAARDTRRAGRGSAGTGPAEQASPTEESTPAGSDWRATLREAGASQGGTPTPARSEAAPMTHATSPLEEVPDGIVIGGSGRELFGESQFASLDGLSTAVSTCTACSLYRTAKNAVPGEGNPHAGLMCIGEAPGATEDELGRPFVGQAGQLLDKILAAIQLARSDVYIANVLKHRPPGNRNPLPDEVQACSPFLVRQIELIQPRVIVAFGTFAAQTLLNTREGIGKLRGKVHRYHGVPLVVTYHPAALLRNPAWKRPTWDDVQLARRLLDRPGGT